MVRKSRKKTKFVIKNGFWSNFWGSLIFLENPSQNGHGLQKQKKDKVGRLTRIFYEGNAVLVLLLRIFTLETLVQRLSYVFFTY